MQAVCKWIKIIQQRIVFLVHVIKKMKRERVCCDNSVKRWLILNCFFIFCFILLLYLNLDFQICFPMKTTFSKSGADCLTLEWNEKPLLGFFANTSHSAEMMLLSSWKYSVHCSSIAIRMCHGGCPVCSIFASLILPAWFNNFKCINDNQDFILIHMSVQCFYQ